MTTRSLSDIIMLGTITGMRSLAGLSALAFRRGGIWPGVMATLAAGEMVADKTSLVGDRTDPLPLAGRALVGALVGAIVAREGRGSVVAGGLIDSMTAVAAAHLAYQTRQRSPVPSQLGGLIEDAIVIGVAASYASRSARR